MPVHYIAQTQNICTRNHESRFSSTPEMWVALGGECLSMTPGTKIKHFSVDLELEGVPNKNVRKIIVFKSLVHFPFLRIKLQKRIYCQLCSSCLRCTSLHVYALA